MNKNWINWISEKPWKYRWFIFLILLRPIIDNFYYLKEVSPLLSPLYIVGVLTPIFAIPVIFSGKKITSKLDTIFLVWSFFIFTNVMFLFVYENDLLYYLQWMLKLTTPVYLYYFLRVFIKNKKDFEGLLIALLYSCIPTLGMMMYEFFINPISVQTTRGVERFEGSYADVMNYAIYISLGFLISSYFYITRENNSFKFSISIFKFIVITAFCLLGLFMAKHTTTIAIIGALLFYFLIINMKKNKGVVIFFGVLLVIAYGVFGDVFTEEAIDPLIDREVEVFDGSRDQEQMFHGRMSRWTLAFDEYQDVNLFAKLIGYPASMKFPYFHIGIAIHNDFLRIFFFTGIFGILIYLRYLYRLFNRTSILPLGLKYLNRGFLIVLLLYSVTTLPTFYPSIMYLIVASWAFLALPLSQQTSED